MPRAHPIALALLLCGVGACPDPNPDIIVPSDNPTNDQPLFADVVLEFTAGPMTTNCVTAGVPQCGQPDPQTGACASFAALGENDGNAFTVGGSGRLEVGFSCNTIIEVGFDPSSDMDGRSTDLVIWGTASPDSMPVISVGDDGTNYATLNPWPKDQGGNYVQNGGFQLEAASPPRASARFVLISNSSEQGSILVDAVEAVPRLP
jgi:hypothetical protein